MPRVDVQPCTNGATYAWFVCPGCGENHAPVVARKPGAPAGPTWGWNGDVERPTFTPSILVHSTVRLTEEEHARLMSGAHVEPRPLVCHSFVREGRIQFLSDCTHALAGQTVDLPEVES